MNNRKIIIITITIIIIKRSKIIKKKSKKKKKKNSWIKFKRILKNKYICNNYISWKKDRNPQMQKLRFRIYKKDIKK